MCYNICAMKTAVITGVSGGMGHATAKRLLQEGWFIFGLDIREPEEFGAASFCFIKTDLTNMESVEQAFAQVQSLDALIHMAGMYDLNSLVEMSEEEFLRIFQINLFAQYRVNKTFLPLLKEGSRIVITSSELAPLDPLPFTGIYAITKTAVEKYAYSLRMEVQLLGIKVIVLRPGAVDTGLLSVSTRRLDAFISGTQYYSCNAKRFKSIVDRVETKKIPPEKIADLAVKALSANNPKYIYKINRNPLLLLMQLLPPRLRTRIIKKILT